MSKNLRLTTSQIFASETHSGIWPFSAVGTRIFGEIHPSSSGQHYWILTSNDYFTKWIESILTRNATQKLIIGFLEDILSRFGCPNKIVTDSATYFKVQP
jgi:hypothetical protein